MRTSLTRSVTLFAHKVLAIFFVFFLNACSETTPHQKSNAKIPLSQTFKSYWFDGTAEVSSYELTQSRYGQLRTGHTTLIYVTEDFLPETQVKANQKSKNTFSVLKLNRNKEFLTGIYPYHIMTSVFTRLGQKEPFVKLSNSVQEWCGQAYLQLNRREALEINAHSYFEGLADQQLSVSITLTEDELWNRIRTQPEQLPTGTHNILPGFEFLRLSHHPIKPVVAHFVLEEDEQLNIYSITYPETGRTLEIAFQKTAPHSIEWWKESNSKDSSYQIHAKRIKTLKIPYWKLNRLGDEVYRDSLNINQ